jgi:hypothetical protein
MARKKIFVNGQAFEFTTESEEEDDSLTYGELKQILEANGMQDADKIRYLHIEPSVSAGLTLIMRNDETNPDGSLKGWQVTIN